jgi:hypothetical protein
MSLPVRVAVVVLLAVLLLPALVSACPLCKDAKSDTDYPGGAASLPKGFYYSILLMVSAPFIVVGAFALRIYRARRRSRELPATPAVRTAGAPLVPDSRGARP